LAGIIERFFESRFLHVNDWCLSAPLNYPTLKEIQQMFSLIITIISIALVAALAVATIYYGGSAFTKGTAKANAAALVSGAQQITGAAALYSNDNGGARATLVQLQPNYLSSAPSMPAGAALTLNAANVTVTGVKDAVCEAIVQSATGDSAAVITATATASAATTTPYDCYDTDTGTAPDNNTFVFKG
jgi:hypothetical protein